MSDDLLEYGEWVASQAGTDDPGLIRAVVGWLGVRRVHRPDGWQSEPSFLRHTASDALTRVQRGWDAEAFDRDARLYSLPGGFTWAEVEAAWRKLTATKPGIDPRTGAYYRRRGGWPSRPEFAASLGTSVPTLKRVMIAADQGTTWPPSGLTT